jgi:D-xylose transport system ATP-binding protein
MDQSQSTEAASGPGSGSQPLLALKGISKSFGAVEALKDVSLEVYPGEVVALVGDNGAGKSTLIKAISGAQPPDSGEFQWEGRPVSPRTPHDATALGIATVYQDLALAENLDVVANLFLGHEEANTIPGVAVLDEVAMEQKSVELLSSLGVTTLKSVRTEVAMLSGGQRQAVAISRSLLGEPKLVMLDEPTAALGIVQTEQILRLIERLRDRGLGVIVISHNLANVFEVADRIAVLRLGRMAQVFKADDSSREEIVASMTGADVKERATEETPL